MSCQSLAGAIPVSRGFFIGHNVALRGASIQPKKTVSCATQLCRRSVPATIPRRVTEMTATDFDGTSSFAETADNTASTFALYFGSTKGPTPPA